MLKKPVQRRGPQARSTKASRQRELLALQKRFEILSVVPNEILHKIFKYLNASDLLRCCCVSKQWNEAASSLVLWQKHFRCLPSKTQALSKDAQTCKAINWKTEVLKCCLLRRKRLVRKLSKQMKWLEIVKWQLTFTTDIKNYSMELTSSDQFLFKHGFTVRWNSMEEINLKTLKSFYLHALVPVFLSDDGKPAKKSITTRSLIYHHKFRGNVLSDLERICTDEESVTIYKCDMLYFGIWNASIQKNLDVSFVVFTSTFDHVKEKILNASSNRMADIPKHIPIEDDVDREYGCHGYKCNLQLRNCRKLYLTEDSILDGWETGDGVVVEYERPSDYNFYDSEETLVFTWKSNYLKGVISNVIIIDVVLIDLNGETPWSFSFLGELKQKAIEKDNYNYDNYEVIASRYEEKEKKFEIQLIMDSISNKWAVKTLRFNFTKRFINEWFGKDA